MESTNNRPKNREEIHFNLNGWQFDKEFSNGGKAYYFCTYHRQTVLIDEDEFDKYFRKYIAQNQAQNEEGN